MDVLRLSRGSARRGSKRPGRGNTRGGK
jgi:hypothetical protein